MQQILAKIRHIAEQYPRHIAITENQNSLDYSSLNHYSDVLARKLTNGQSNRAKAVAYLGRVDTNNIIALLAAHKAGVAFVYLDSKLPETSLLDIIRHAQVSILMINACEQNLSERLNTQQDLIVLRLDNWQLNSSTEKPSFNKEIDERTLSHIRYTSGSSGNPKGVPLNRRHVDRMLKVFDEFMQPKMTDRFGLFGHFWPLIILRALSIGVRLDCFDFPNHGASALNEWMMEHKITHVFTYPVLFRQLMNASDQILTEVLFVHLSGEPLSLEDIRAFEKRCQKHACLHNSYGSSEYPWIAGYFHRHGEHLTAEHIPLGYPVAPAAVHILNKQGRQLPAGQIGEIVVTSDYLPESYHRDVERSIKTFRPVPSLADQIAYHTGDLGYFDETGLLHTAGRNDQQLKVRGHNVSPVDVEHTLIKHPAISQVAVIPLKGTADQSQLACHYTVCSNSKVSINELKIFLSEMLPSQLIPVFFRQHQSFPLTSTGKLNRKALGLSLKGSATSTEAYTHNDLERLLFEIWSELLGHDNFNRSDNFFNVGGDSLLAMSMLVKIEKTLKQRLTLEMLMTNDFCINSLQSQLQKSNSFIKPVSITHNGEQTPIFLTHLAGGHFSDYLPLVKGLKTRHSVIGLQPRGLLCEDEIDHTIETMAGHCIHELEKQADPGSATIIGYSFGAILAFAMASTLQKKSKHCPGLILIDPPTHFVDPMRLLKRIALPFRSGEYKFALHQLSRLIPYTSEYGEPPTDIKLAHRTALLCYQPRAINLNKKTMLILASDNPNVKLIESTWVKLLNTQVNIVKMQGTHRSVMQQPNAQMIAENISDALGVAS